MSPPPTYTLYTPQGSFRAFGPLIAAEINGISVHVVTDPKVVEKAAKQKCPTGQAPFLETTTCHDGKEVILFASSSIARYIGGLRTDTGLLGTSFQEKAAVNNWMDWAAAVLELPACLLFYPVAGFMKVDQKV